MKIKLSDIIFWLIIIIIVGIALWLLSGSPPETNALISIALFVAASELLLWRKLFEIDKKTAISFERIKNNLNNIKTEMNNNHKELKKLIKN